MNRVVIFAHTHLVHTMGVGLMHVGLETEQDILMERAIFFF
jgi:hypothetical protein